MEDVVLNGGDTAWMLASTALVLLMTPGLAFFYGGMVRTKSVLNMMMMSMVIGANVRQYLWGITNGMVQLVSDNIRKKLYSLETI